MSATATVPRTGFETLTERQRQILRLYPELGLNYLVAHRLGLSEQTVKNHITAILRKTGAVSMGQAAVFFDRHERRDG